MKRCSQCGMQFGDDKLSCPRCGGAPVSGGPTPNSHRNDYAYGANYQNRSYMLYKPDGTRQINWYESIWFIGLTFLCGMWPVTIAMAALRVYRNSMYPPIRPGQAGQNMRPGQAGPTGQNQNARPGQAGPGSHVQMANGQMAMQKRKTKGIWKVILGSLLGGVGLLFLATVPTMQSDLVPIDLVMSAMFIGGGAALIGTFFAKNKDWHQYEAVINNRGNTKISHIAKKLNISETRARNQLQKMINKGFLAEPENRIGAYIDGEYDLVVITQNGKPLVPVEQTMAKDIAAQKAQEAAAAEKARRERPMTVEERFLLTVEDAAKVIKDEEALGYLKSMHQSVRNINKLLKESPEDAEKKSVKDMRESYIPSTTDMIRKYLDTTTSEDMKAQIKGMFSTMAMAYTNIEKQLKEKVEIDLGIDLEVMKQKLAREGLLDSDFDVRV